MRNQNHVVTKQKAKKLGLEDSSFRKAKDVNELIKQTPNYVITKVVNSTMISVDGMQLAMHKGDSLAMPVEVYLSCERDRNNKRIHLKPHKRKFAHFFKRYRGQDLNQKSLLVMRTGGIGDLIFSQPLLKRLKEMYPDCRIAYATAPRHMPIIEAWPNGIVDAVIPIPFKLEILQRTHYHLAFEGSIERNEEGHTKNAYDIFSDVANVDVDFTDPKYRIEMRPDEKIVSELKPKLPNNFVVLQMRATSPIRMMDVDNWYSVIKGIHDNTDLNFVFLDTPQYNDYYNKVISDFSMTGLTKERFKNACKISESINHAVNIISLSEGVIGIDSAMIHICEGLKKPGICIYGPFKSHLRIRYYDYIKGIEPKPENIECNAWPCMRHGDEIFKCPYKVGNAMHPQCTNAVDTDEIVNAAVNMFKK